MPAFPTPSFPVTAGTFTMSLTDYRGETGTVSVDVPDTTTDAELDSLAGFIGAVSNAGLYAKTKTVKESISPATATALDEAENSVATKAELVFIDNSLQTRSVSIPAPDSQFVGADGFSIENAGAMATAITQIALVLNGGAGGSGSFVFSRGYIVTKARKTKRGNVRPVFREPTVTDAPGDGDGV